MISASCILAVFMELAVNHGSATASLSGEDCFVIKVTRASDLQLSFVERFRFTSKEKPLTIKFVIAVSFIYETTELLLCLLLQPVVKII